MRKLYHPFSLLVALLLFSGCLGSLGNRSNARLDALQAAKHLALGCHLYAEDNNGKLPATTTLLMPYVDLSYDPEDFVMVATGKLREIENPDTAVLLRKKTPLKDDQQAVAYVDGHAEIIPLIR